MKQIDTPFDQDEPEIPRTTRLISRGGAALHAENDNALCSKLGWQADGKVLFSHVEDSFEEQFVS
jgi:hypothetical protein